MASHGTTDDEWVDVVVDLPVRTKDNSDDITLQDKAHHDSAEPDAPFYAHAAAKAVAKLEKDASPVFFTDCRNALWSAFFDNLPLSQQQRFRCKCCRNFMKRYGSLVQVDDDGIPHSLLWEHVPEDMPEFICNSIQSLEARIVSSRVLGEFKVTEHTKSVGFRKTGSFYHMYLEFPATRIGKREIKGFAAPSTSDLAEMLERILSDFSLKTVRRAAQFLIEDKLPYADNHKSAIRWLLDFHETRKIEKASDAQARHNLVYRYAASAWEGCLHKLRSGALSTLLKDIESGKDFDEIKASWQHLNNPSHYMRPKASPNVAHIAAAEALMKELGVTANDMRRREYTQSEIPEHVIMWRTESSAKSENAPPYSGGIFDKLRPSAPSVRKSSDNDTTPPTRISFTKFVTDVLPRARKLAYRLGLYDNIIFCITGLEGTKPLMQWHDEENRVSCFRHSERTPVTSYSVSANAWTEITCIIPFPHLWDGIPHTTTFPLAPSDSEIFKSHHKNHGFTYLFCLENVKLDRYRSLCLFPTYLKGEFHGVRKTIEAYSNLGVLERVPDIQEKGGIVAGVQVGRAYRDMKHLLRVTDKNGDVGTYEIVLFE